MIELPSSSTILSLLWQKRLLVIKTILLFTMLGLCFLWTATPLYKVSMVIGPTSANGAAAMGARTSDALSLSPSLAEHADNEALSDYARYQQLLTSYDAAARLITDTPSLLQSLFASEWDAKRQRWRFHWGVRAVIGELQSRSVGRPGWRAPDAERLQSYIQHHLVVTPISGSPMRRLTFSHADKGVAVNILLGVHKAADAILREEAAKRSDAIITSITDQLERVTIAEHRAALTRLLAEQERTQLLINVDLPYAADLITPPRGSTMPDWPNPALVLSFAELLALLVSGGFIVRQFMLAQKSHMQTRSKIRLLK